MAFLIAGPVTSSFSQSPPMAIKFGASVTNLAGSVSTDPVFRYHFGIKAFQSINDAWSLQPELLFSSEGAQTDYKIFRYQYIDFPVMMSYGPQRTYLSFGPQVSLLISGREIEKSSGNSAITTDRADIQNFSIAVGLGTHISNAIGTEFRYVWGLTNISNRFDMPKQKWNTRTLQISLYYNLIRK